MSPIIPFDRSKNAKVRSVSPMSLRRVEKLLVFTIGSRELATEAVKIFEVMIVPKLATVAGAPPFLLGMANVRGNIIPIVDIHGKMSETRPDQAEKQRMIVVKIAGEYIGFLADKIDMQLIEGEIENPTARKSAKSKGKLSVIESNLKDRKAYIGDRVIPLFEPETLLTVDELEELKRIRAGF